MFYQKQKLKIICCRIYKTLNVSLSQEELIIELLNIDTNKAELEKFTNTVLSVQGMH